MSSQEAVVAALLGAGAGDALVFAGGENGRQEGLKLAKLSGPGAPIWTSVDTPHFEGLDAALNKSRLLDITEPDGILSTSRERTRELVGVG